MSTDRYELVRVDREIVQGLIDDPSAPVVVISLERTQDGTADMLFQAPEVTDEMVKRAVAAFWAQDLYEHTRGETVDAMRDALKAAFSRPVVAPSERTQQDA
jgi:hypothetical protein